MFSFGFDYDQPKVEEQELPFSYKETEFEKALNNLNLDDMINIDFDFSKLTDLNPDSILGNQEDIYRILKEGLNQKNNLLENAEKDILEIDYKIDYYKSYIFDENKRPSKIQDNNFLLRKGFYLTEVEIEEKIRSNEMFYPTLKSEKKVVSSPSSKKSIDAINYQGFSDHELTELPGYVEAPQLLNNLSSKMGFKKGFLKYWTVIIRTDASIAILLDSFWWFYLKHFKKDPALEIDAYRFFSRISESFAGLLFNIHSTIRDRFFGHYANFLSQAIYLAFYNVFPDCVLQFNDNFKEEISNTVHEWILGLRPIPESYLNWQINDEIRITGDTKVSSNNEILGKINNLEKLLNSLGDKDPVVKFDESNSRGLYSRSRDDFNKQVDAFYKKNNNESHAVGEGSIIEMIPFNLKGKSALIKHYMNLHNFNSDSSNGFKMTRSEIVQNPPKTAVTYRDKIYETLERAKTLDDAFKKSSEETQNEIKKIERERKKVVAEFLRIKRSASSSSAKDLSANSSKSTMNNKKSNSSGSIKMELNESDE